MVESEEASAVNLHLNFPQSDAYQCNVSYMERECGGAVLFANLSLTDFASQSIKMEQINNETYLLYVSVLQMNESLSLSYVFEDLNLEFDILTGVEDIY